MLTKAAIVFTICVVFSAGFSSADQCVQCNSKEDAYCSQNPQMLKPEECGVKSACYVRIKDGLTIRGCVSQIDQRIRDACMNVTLENPSCFICENNGAQVCNGDIFPKLRLRCHTCKEDNLKGVCFTALDGNAPVCNTYIPGDRCFTRRTLKTIERGCMSDATKCAPESHCLICDGDGCNNKAGNATEIPLAPNSATAWTSTMALLLVPAVIGLQLTL